LAAAVKRRCPRQVDTPTATNYSIGGPMATMIRAAHAGLSRPEYGLVEQLRRDATHGFFVI
jgi:hypothetical protein